MIKTNVRIFLIFCLCLLALTACRHGEDLPVPSPEVETVQLIISVPNTAAGSRAIGDPGTAVDEGADWDRLAVILAYTDDSEVTLPGGSKVQVTILSKADFEKLPPYNKTQFRLLSIDAQPGTVYIYGVTYSVGEEDAEETYSVGEEDAEETYSVGEEDAEDLNNLEQAIKNCKTKSAVEALTISNDYASTGTNTIDYAMYNGASSLTFLPSTGTNTIDYAKFVSVATGYYRGEAATGNQPAAFTIQQGGTGQVGNMPTMTLTRLATKLDIQWDAADAYEQGYTDVKVESFSYNGKVFGRLFPDITGITISDNKEKSWEFYNTSEISQRNGRVYHYTFPDGEIDKTTSTTTPNVTFNITAKKSGATIPDDGYTYTLNFQEALKQATWYKVNATIKGITGNGNITFGDNSGTSVGS